MKVDFYVDVFSGQKEDFYVHNGTMEKTDGCRRYKFTVDIPYEEIDEDLGEVKAKEEKE